MIKEYCGVAAVFSRKKLAVNLVKSILHDLQHRGQDAAGIAAARKDKLWIRKAKGMVQNIKGCFEAEIAIGHTRYPTTSTTDIANKYDIPPTTFGKSALALNGNIANDAELRDVLKGKFTFRGCTDSETLLYLMLSNSLKEDFESIKHSLIRVEALVNGSFSVAFIINNKLYYYRSSDGRRPLWFGKGRDWLAVASESVALQTLEAKFMKEIAPGTLGMLYPEHREEQILPFKGPGLCMFELTYFARTPSIFYGRSVGSYRNSFGNALSAYAKDIDVIIPVPASSLQAGSAVATSLGIPLAMGLERDRFFSKRTFIMNCQEKRERAIRKKFHIVSDLIEGKRIGLVDDSIVRGTTLKSLVKYILEVGKPKDVEVFITTPPIVNPCIYGIDMKTKEELIASNKTLDEIATYMGVSHVHYLPLNEFLGIIGNSVCFECLVKKS